MKAKQVLSDCCRMCRLTIWHCQRGNSLHGSTLQRHHTSHQEKGTGQGKKSRVTNLTALGGVKDGEEWRPGRQRWHSPGIIRLLDHKRVANDSQTESPITNKSHMTNLVVSSEKRKADETTRPGRARTGGSGAGTGVLERWRRRGAVRPARSLSTESTLTIAFILAE